PTYLQENQFYERVIKEIRDVIEIKEIKSVLSEFRKIRIEEGIKIRADLLKLLQIIFYEAGNKILSGVRSE
ncbi:MAG: hypothetical protein ACFFDN_50195, partial [Candidatus Hodarchaeota archaeon]